MLPYPPVLALHTAALKTKFSFVIKRELLYHHLFIKKKKIQATKNLFVIHSFWHSCAFYAHFLHQVIMYNLVH